MKIEQFEDILAWQKAKNMTIMVYTILKDSRDFGFRDQICRASVSVMNNIAEGFERKSDNEFKHFLFIAKGSCGEVRSMTYLAMELKYIGTEESTTLISLAREISKMLSGLIKSLK